MTPERVTEFKSKDGKRFDTEKEATRHDEIREVEEEFRSAKSRWTSVIIGLQETADGQRVSARHHFYYRIRHGMGLPYIEDVSLWPHQCEVDEDDRGIVRWSTYDQHRGHVQHEVRLSELFYSKKAARIEAHRLGMEVVASFQETLDEEAERLGIST